MSPEQEALIISKLPFVRHLAHRFANQYKTISADIYSEAYLALCRCVKRIDVQITDGYICVYVVGAIKQFLRMNSLIHIPMSRIRAKDTAYPVVVFNMDTLRQRTVNSQDDFDNEIIKLLDPLNLTPQQQTIICMLASGYKIKDICESLSMTRYKINIAIEHVQAAWKGIYNET